MGLSYAVVGGGMQGRAAAVDLAARKNTDHVALVDVVAHKGRGPAPKVEWVAADALSDPASLDRALHGADAAVVALPGSIAQRALPIIVGAGVPVVDMSFTPEVRDTALDQAAGRSACTLVRDVGVAPGLSHLLAAEAAAELGGLSALTILVGGLPKTPPSDPFRHAVYFNPLDLVSEYTRPARMRVAGRGRAPAPLAAGGRVLLFDDELGALEAFASDGLRTLLDSYPRCPEMREMTLRWPGHLDYMTRLAKEGKLNGRAAERTAADLLERFPGESFPDWLLMEVQAEGPRGSYVSRVQVGGKRGATAMARATACTAAAAARGLAAGAFSRPGLHPPEEMGAHAALKDSILRDLADRKVTVQTAINGIAPEGRQAPSARLTA